MTITWTPDPATIPWLIEQDNVPFAINTISVVDSTPKVVTGYTHSIIGSEPLNDLVVTTSLTGVNVSAPNALPNAFPAVDIQYEIGNIQYHVKKFSELPSNLEELIAYRPCQANTKEWTFRVVATFVGGTTQTADYIIKIYTDYSSGKTKMLEVINASRH